MITKNTLTHRIKILIWFFIIALAISGITALPLVWELNILNNCFGINSSFSSFWPAFSAWISKVNTGIKTIDEIYPFALYGTDWLAFAHIVIAILFIGPLRDPLKNIWVIEFGMIACILVIPLALIMGQIRDIPFFWRLIDCSFGVIGIIPLAFTRMYIIRLSFLEN